MKRLVPLVLLAAGAVQLAGISEARATARPDDMGTLFKVNDENPKSNIPDEEARNAHPVEFGYFLQDLILRAEEAFNKKDWDNAIKYWDALANTVPSRAISFRRLCTAYEQKGELIKAEGSCFAILTREGVLVEDHLHMTRLVLKHFREPNDPKVAAIRASMIDGSVTKMREHFKSKPPAAQGEDSGESGDKSLPFPVQIELIACRLGALLNDTGRLKQCVTDLKGVGADPRLIVPFNWAAATASGDEAAIQGALKEARNVGLSDATLKSMTDGASQFAAQRALNEAGYKEGKANEAKAQTRKRVFQVGGAFAGLLSLAGLGWLFSRRNSAASKSVSDSV